MFLIKNCSACGRRLRFPIDKGVIRVKCLCGAGFIADPDSPGLYRGATFDLSHGTPSRSAFAQRTREIFQKANPGWLVPALINAFLAFKYDLQNFRLLPASRQRRIVIIGLAIIAVFLLAVYLLFRSAPAELPEDGVVI
jgi:hypothetical protein